MQINIIYVILPFFVAVNLLLGLFVLRSNPQKRVNQSFFVFMLAVVAWIILNAAADTASTNAANLILSRMTMAAAAAIPWALYLFATLFPDTDYINSKFALLITIPFVIISYLSVGTNLIIQSSAQHSGVTDVHFGSFSILYAAYFGIYTVTAFVSLLRKYRIAKGVSRLQIQYLLFGFGLSIISGSVTNLILPVGFNIFAISSFGPVTTTFILVLTSYSILANHLFDIRVIIRRTIVYSILLITLFSAYSLILFLFAQVFNFQSSGNVSLILNFLATLAIGFSFDPLRRILQERTDKFLYRKEYEQQSVLKTLSSDLNNVIGLDEALETVMQTIVKTLKIQHAITYVFQPGEGGKVQIKRIKQIGFSTEKNLLLQERDFVIEYFEQYGRTVSRAQLEEELRDEARDIRRQKPNTEGLSSLIRDHARKQTMVKRLTGLDCQAAVPLCLNNQSIGLLLLSGKLSQESFNISDLQLLDLAGEVAISSIQKARLYEGDKMKSEFVSIASHELLTPISAIEGYLSMILDEHIGTVDEQARGYLEKVYISSRRLSQLVKDLLSVSRLESGKMTITPQAVDMQKMIHDTLDQLRFLAAKKGLELNYEASARPLPLVRADPDRVMQILINLVSNAIKYTPSGSISITAIRYRRGILKVDVKDTGFGLSKEQRLHLFEKFYRVDSPETVGIIGTGLGLYITKSILERMGGTISIESVLKRGSTFSFTLPIFEAEASLPVA